MPQVFSGKRCILSVHPNLKPTTEGEAIEKQRKLLVVSPYCILPADTGGRIRIYELVQGLARQNVAVSVLMPMTPALYTSKTLNAHLGLHVVPYPFILPFLLTERPFPYFYWMSFHPGYAFFFRRFLKHFDVIQFEGVSFAGLLREISKDKTVVYDAHNVEYDYATSEKRSPWVQKISSERIFHLEKQLVERANQILTCDEEDAKRLASLYHVRSPKFTTIANGIQLDQTKDRTDDAKILERFPGLTQFSRRAIFAGSDVAHNRTAVSFLVDKLAPQLQDECAFIIKGQCGRSFKQNAAKNIFFDLKPGDISEYSGFCTIAVNPITQGSGTSLKVLDFLAKGLPLISTDFGMRGYDDLKKYVVIAGLDGFAEALRKVQEQKPEMRPALERYSWESLSQELHDTLFPQNQAGPRL